MSLSLVHDGCVSENDHQYTCHHYRAKPVLEQRGFGCDVGSQGCGEHVVGKQFQQPQEMCVFRFPPG